MYILTFMLYFKITSMYVVSFERSESSNRKKMFEKTLMLNFKLTFKLLFVDFLLQFISLSFDPQGKTILELFYLRNLLFVLVVRTTHNMT